MVSNRLKSDARSLMRENPGMPYLVALRTVAGSAVSPGGRPAATRRKLPAVFDAVLAELDTIPGQAAMKEQALRVLAAIHDEGRRRSCREEPQPCNIVITGMPGTGKDYLAAILARGLHAAGVTASPELTPSNGPNLMSRTPGRATTKTRTKLEQARGGLLVIDDACELGPRDGREYAPAHEARTTLTAAMTVQTHNTTVAACGYVVSIDRLLDFDGDFAALFPHRIDFGDCTGEDLWKVAQVLASERGLVLDGELVFLRAITEFERLDGRGVRALDIAGNIRLCRNVVEQAQGVACRRLAASADLAALPDEEFNRITAEDVTTAFSNIARGFGIIIPPAG